ncbi:hypothetical protein [Anoxybacillus suryakundensis]|uniref:Uncharacterized protein n=1 Tax=Anoxybacillus suryakundensis TaxID=1325335 RepID=A0A0K6GQE5_9BACL|nr:hypothetical protein [Anoxybacillus suryakundensis]CUA80721.1 hypothetical protein Ga0061060_11357 [Anoxybacillus suryakundensis]
MKKGVHTEVIVLKCMYIEAKIDVLRQETNARFQQVNEKMDLLDLSDTQETVDLLSPKTLQHERKLHLLSRQS